MAVFTVSSHIAEKVDQFSGHAKERSITIIQDIHEQIAPQINLSEIISELEAQAAKRNKVLVIAVEGATGVIPVDTLKSISDDKTRQMVTTGLLRSGYLFGEEYAALSAPLGRIKIIGVESQELYQKQVRVREASLYNRNLVLQYLHQIKDQLQSLIPSTFAPQLREIEKTRESFENGKLTLDEFLSHLHRLHPQMMSENLLLREWNSLKSSEDQIDFAEVDRERITLLKRTRWKYTPEEMDLFLRDALLFRDGHMSAQTYYEKLNTQGGPEYPHIAHYSRYLKSASQFSSEALVDNAWKVCEEMSRRWLADEEAQKLYAYLRFVDSEIMFYSLRLTPEEWSSKRTSHLKKQIALQEVHEYIAAPSDHLGRQPNIVGPTAKIYQGAFEASHRYYQLSDRRTASMFKNFLPLLKTYDYHKFDLLFITGGFHTAGFSKYLKQAGVGYQVYRPLSETSVILPDSIEYPVYAQVVKESASNNFLRPQGGLSAKGGFAFVRMLLERATRQIYGWPKKLGSVRDLREKFSVLGFLKKVFWITPRHGWLSLLSATGSHSGTSLNTALRYVTAGMARSEESWASHFHRLIRDADPSRLPIVILIDLDSFGAQDFINQGTYWTRLINGLNKKMVQQEKMNSHVIFISQGSHQQIDPLIRAMNKIQDGLSFEFKKGTLLSVSKQWTSLHQSSDLSRARVRSYVFSNRPVTVDRWESVVLSGVPHLALATLAFSRFDDPQIVLESLVRLFEKVSPFSVQGQLNDQITQLLLAKISA